MNPDKQRIAIAEACGWTFNTEQCSLGPITHATKPGCGPNNVPDYVHDLNAMHDAVNSLDLEDRLGWIVWMDRLTSKPTVKYDQAWLPERLIEAKCSVWAEAFLRIIGRWEDNE